MNLKGKVARLMSAGELKGTAWLISTSHALTAAHCVSAPDGIIFPDLTLEFHEGPCLKAMPNEEDLNLDWDMAILPIQEQGYNLERFVTQLSRRPCGRRDICYLHGHPSHDYDRNPDGFSLRAEVINPNHQYKFNHTPVEVIQFADTSAWENIQGISGAPVYCDVPGYENHAIGFVSEHRPGDQFNIYGVSILETSKFCDIINAALFPFSDDEPVRESKDTSRISHLKSPFACAPFKSYFSGESLPYHELDDRNRERMINLLLLKEGKAPRYFYKSKKKQYSIDFLVGDDSGLTVYRSVNTYPFMESGVQDALNLFETEWLGANTIPSPKKLVLCCPSLPRQIADNRECTGMLRWFLERTEIEVVLWHREYLNGRLKHLPDLVADIFCDHTVEWFCGLNDWNSDLFLPLMPVPCGKAIERYLLLKEAGRIYVDPDQMEEFREAIEMNASLLIRGLPGSGKTITSMALAESYRKNEFRVFYLDLRFGLKESDIITGIRRRLSQPTLFIIDNCQGKFEMLDLALNRLSGTLARMSGKVFLVFLTRNVSTEKGIPRGDYSEFEEHFRQNKAILHYKTSPGQFRQIIEISNPSFIGLSKERLEKIFNFCAGDLFLLTQLLETIESPNEIEDLNLEILFEPVLIQYFGAPTVLRPGFQKLAALAQFDIAPPVASFDAEIEKEDNKAASQFLVRADRPPSYFFLHSSAAELIFRALVWSSGKENYFEPAADHLLEYFRHQIEDKKKFAYNISQLISNRLKLMDSPALESRLKSRILADEKICKGIESNFNFISLKDIMICLIIIEGSDENAAEFYLDLIAQKLDDGTIPNMIASRPFWEISLFLYLLNKNYPSICSRLSVYFQDEMLEMISNKMTFQNFLICLAYLTEPNDYQWPKLLNTISDEKINLLFQRTITSGRSIGTIGMTLKTMKKADESLLKELEKKIGVERYLKLILSLGTVVELFSFITHSSVVMAKELIGSLDDPILDGLVEKTIAAGRSIGTLNMTLMMMKKADESLLKELEKKIGVERYLKLILSLGTIFELFNVIGDSSLAMAEELIGSLDDPILDGLVEKTIAAGRSIGTIGMTLMTMKKADESLLKELEKKIGVERYLKLILSLGTIFELFKVIEHSSLAMAKELIGSLDDPILDGLVEKTIAAGRSIGTLNMTLMTMKKADESLLKELEKKIGVERYLKLILSLGTIFELFKVIEHSSLAMAEELIGSLDDPILDGLVEKTIAAGRSIGTIGMTLMTMKKADESLLKELEKKIGVERYLKLILSLGTIFELFKVIEHSSLAMAKELIGSLDDPILDGLVEKTIAAGRSIGTLNMTLMTMKKADESLLKQLEKKIGPRRWWWLIQELGTLRILSQILQYMDTSFKQQMITTASIEFSLSDWENLIRQGDFGDLAYFIQWKSFYFNEVFSIQFLKKLKPTFKEVIRKESWKSLNAALKQILKTPDSNIRSYIDFIVQIHLKKIHLETLRFKSFAESANCIALLWNKAFSRRDEINEFIDEILPDEKHWYEDEGFLSSARLLFWCLTDGKANPENAHRVIMAGNAKEVASFFPDAKALDIYLYIWDLYSLWSEWEKKDKNTFGAFLNAEIHTTAIEVLTKRLHENADENEMDNLISLIGLLCVLNLDILNFEKKIGWIANPPFFLSEFTDRAKNKTFVPGVLFLLALERLFDKKNQIPRHDWLIFMSKDKKYSMPTAAVDDLFDIVRFRCSNN